MSQIETINGHKYLVTRDANNKIVEQLGADDPIQATPPPILAKAKKLVTAPLPYTALQRDQAIKVILALLIVQSDVSDAI